MEPSLYAAESGDIALVESLSSSLPNPDRSLKVFERFRREAPDAFERVRASPTALRNLLTIGSYSTFLAESGIRHPDWLLDLSESSLHRVFKAEEFEASLRGVRSAYDLAAFRRRQLLRIVLRDVLGFATLFDVTEELSNLADAILNVAYRQILRQTSEEFGVPHSDSGPALLSVISLGKLGGRELNYSSDIDLMFIYSGNGENSEGLTNREFFKKIANQLTELLSTYTGEGMCYRVDLRLRPDGRYGEVCQSLEGAKQYYQSRARDWELQMLIKARISAGDPQPGRELLDFVEPTIYSTSTDFNAIESVSEARERIHEKLKRSNQPGIDVKLTRGGIRDIEFLVQCLQRLHGGRDPWLRHGSTQQALARLHDKELLSDSEYSRLSSAYQFLRVLEHRLQFDEDRQTHTLPADPATVELLARKMPYSINGSLERELEERLAAVRELYEKVIHAQRPAQTSLAQPRVPRQTNRWQRFLERISQRAEWLQILEGNAEAAACALDLFNHSKFFGDQLIGHPELIEEIQVACSDRQGRTGFQPPADVPALRVFFRQQMMRIQADSVYHGAPIFKTLKRTSNLADAVIASAYTIAVNEALISAPPRSTRYEASDQMVVVALGRLGMREFDIASDADLVFAIPDTDAEEIVFWTYVAERLIHAIGAYTGEGVLFTVDTRLRPNGREGALVQTEGAFHEYFEKHAEAWEGITYMKARAVAGNTNRATEFLSELQQVDWRRYGQSGRSRKELAGMRGRLEKEQGRRHPLKAGPGGYYDIDFALMYYRLKGAGMFFKSLTTPERVDVLEKMGHLEREDAEFLREAATFYRAVDHGLRVSTGHAEGRLPSSPAQLSALSELVVRWDPASANMPLDARLREIQQRTRAFYERVFT